MALRQLSSIEGGFLSLQGYIWVFFYVLTPCIIHHWKVFGAKRCVWYPCEYIEFCYHCG